MADFSKCSAGTLFYGKAYRLNNISRWWKHATPHSPSIIVDSTKIRLIALYLTQSYVSADSNPVKELPGLRSPYYIPTEGCSSLSILPRCKSPHWAEKNQCSTSGQFWQKFVANEDIGLGEVNLEICKHFSRIPFHHWIQAALGYRSELVDGLFLSVSLIRHRYNQLNDRFVRKNRVRSLPEISNLHPLTKAVFDERCEPFLPMDQINFILDPIKSVIKGCSRSALAQRLILLGVRFESTFIQPAMVNWSSNLSTTFEFLESLHHKSPLSLARSITEKDVEVLVDLTIEQLQSGISTAADTRWAQLCRDVKESLASSQAKPRLLRDLAEELHLRRNYFSMTAVVAGVRAAKAQYPKISTNLDEFSKLEEFLDETNNYAYCRNCTISDQGLPWLVPFRAQFESLVSMSYSSTGIAVANLALQICCYTKFYL